MIPVVLQLAAVAPSGPAVALHWEVAPEVRRCPTEAWFRRELAAELGYDPYSVGTGGFEVRVSIRPSGPDSIEPHVSIRGPGDASPREFSTRPVEATRCRSLLSASAGELRDIILPRQPVVVVEPATTPPTATTPPRDLATRTWHGAIEVWGGVATGGVPATFSAAFALDLRLSRASFALVLGAGVEPFAGDEVACPGQGSVAVSMQRVQGDVAACFVGGPISVCGLVLARALLAYAPSLTGAGRTQGAQAGAGVRVEARWSPWRQVSLNARLEGALASPWRFTAVSPRDGASCELFDTGLGTAQISLGASFGLW